MHKWADSYLNPMWNWKSKWGNAMYIRACIRVLVLAMCCIAAAQAMRCGDKLVLEGDDKYDVRLKCGEPQDIEQYQENIPLYNWAGYQIGVSTRIVEKWIYQRSSVDFRYELYFDNDKVKEITTNRSS